MASANERREIMLADGPVLLLAGSDPLRQTQDTPDRDALTRDLIQARLTDGFTALMLKPNS